MLETRGRAAGLWRCPRLCGGGREPRGDKRSEKRGAFCGPFPCDNLSVRDPCHPRHVYRFLPPACLRLTTWKRAIKTKMGSCAVELFPPLQPAETRALQDAIERSSRFLDLPVTACYTPDRTSQISCLEPEARRAIWLSRPKGKHGVGYDLVDHVWWRPCARRTVFGCQ
jgi:hypothetical protein